jgi:hypothetical protein
MSGPYPTADLSWQGAIGRKSANSEHGVFQLSFRFSFESPSIRKLSRSSTCGGHVLGNPLVEAVYAAVHGR